MEKVYKLTMNEEQLRTVQRSLEAFSRVCTGQLDIAMEVACGNIIYGMDSDKRTELYKACREAQSILSEGLIPEGASFGIYSPFIDKSASIAYNALQVVRHQFWKEQDMDVRSNHTVDSSICICNGEKPITIEAFNY